jgi:2-oxo-4-hydroxy-4-carboxy-5-ureidoimidazoline decarboxylase
LPYADFHTDYKKTKLAPDELVLSVSLPRRFSGYVSLARKVGARSAQAISKVCMAALGRMEQGAVDDLHIALGSVAPIPFRLRKTEQIVSGKPLNESVVAMAKATAMQEVAPIDDIRSTARYRAAVAGNLVAEFLRSLAAIENNAPVVLTRWNESPFDEAVVQILSCCGSRAWAREMATRRPFQSAAALSIASDEVWHTLPPSDWLEAFHNHLRIGESDSHAPSGESSSSWAMQEQKSVAGADDATKIALAEANREYEKKFGHIFIVCATGKSAEEMLTILADRMNNEAKTELREAAEQQRQITQIRLKKWLHP